MAASRATKSYFESFRFYYLIFILFIDAGHGCIMLAFGLYMCIKEKMLEARKINSEVWNYFFNGRYLITIMAMFSIYTGNYTVIK